MRLKSFVSEITLTEGVAYHGSPFKFEKFSTKYMGKGEGNQMIGWGIYLAGSRNVARYYRDEIIDIDTIRKINAEMSHLADVMNQYKVHGQYRKFTSEFGVAAAKRYDELMNQKLNMGSYIYTVEIPDDDKFLQWDATLENQSEYVKSALNQWSVIEVSDPSKLTGETIYNMAVRYRKSPQYASEYLYELGIVGNKYYDAFSRLRAGGGKTFNYVLFNDKDITVTSVEEYQRGEDSFYGPDDDHG